MEKEKEKGNGKVDGEENGLEERMKKEVQRKAKKLHSKKIVYFVCSTNCGYKTIFLEKKKLLESLSNDFEIVENPTSPRLAAFGTLFMEMFYFFILKCKAVIISFYLLLLLCLFGNFFRRNLHGHGGCPIFKTVVGTYTKQFLEATKKNAKRKKNSHNFFRRKTE